MGRGLVLHFNFKSEDDSNLERSQQIIFGQFCCFSSEINENADIMLKVRSDNENACN